MQPIEILREDFEQTLGFIDKCDRHIFQVRNWAIATSTAMVAFSISQRQETLLLAFPIVLLTFIYIELIQKSFQDTAIQHTDDLSERIDKFLVNPEAADLLEGYSHSFGRKLKYPSVRCVFSILGNYRRWHILNFYFLLAATLIISFLVVEFLV